MAGLQGLLPLIYHESQQSGSLLCAQHALNSLLQGNYFTAPDLSELANHIDHLEQSYNEDIRGQASANMDDTGFFSVQVLENALHVWGLSLIRWRSEAMKPYQNRPDTQLAFVLNQDQHWYTLRRFGSPGENGHWFNLDSTKPSPQWISKTYLSMFLQQAEQEGYSTFAVVPVDPSNAHPLPRCDADDVASTLPEPSSTSSAGSRIPSSEPGFEDEDMDLQAALQASLASAERGGSTSSSGPFSRLDNYPSPVIPSSRTFPGFPPELTSIARDATSGGQPNIPPNQDPYGNADLDPVSASMERNRIIMERMRQEQEAALREQYEEEVARFGQAQDRFSRQRREAASEVEDEGEGEDEDEPFRRAMEESLAERRARTGDDVEMEGSDDEEYYDAPTTRLNTHTTVDRVYDDDDAELQAALKASLETMPPGFSLPPSASPPPPHRLTNTNEPPSAVTSASETMEESGAETETETETEPDAEGVNSETAQAARQEVSIEEMRRRRLARFGG
ncbi:Josephin-domain-containing protein [Imleria badia]|nr:Josephin-domain-containing protein [Imleria badia]